MAGKGEIAHHDNQFLLSHLCHNLLLQRHGQVPTYSKGLIIMSNTEREIKLMRQTFQPTTQKLNNIPANGGGHVYML